MALGVSERNEYALLKGIGVDCAGALLLLPESIHNIAEENLIPSPEKIRGENIGISLSKAAIGNGWLLPPGSI